MTAVVTPSSSERQSGQGRVEPPFGKLLVANRGEIAIRVLRAAAELKVATVALYSYEDRYSLHRYKADESYQIGRDRESLRPYLDIDAIIHLAKRRRVDAIHPGYGLLSENVRLAERCRQEGIVFVGPTPEVMRRIGDKIAAKDVARRAGVPVIEDSHQPLTSVEVALAEADRIGFPVVVKAAGGGGGRGMRVARDSHELRRVFDEARGEAEKAFGDGTVFLEKYVEDPKHLEVQILGDNYGNILHLYERDCSVQRRFQKVIEMAPCPSLEPQQRQELHGYALAVAREVGYNNAGTVEFLLDRKGQFYFIEVNPRIQVEHTVTEEVVGIDLVRSQILIAAGRTLADRGINIQGQESISINGYAIQCRISTEDPSNDFQPDFGRVIAYRSPGGFGIRLDAGGAYAGAVISPFFDSLLVKVTAWGRTVDGAASRMQRALREFRIRGVKTNIDFLENVITHPLFLDGRATVRFIEDHPELLRVSGKRDRATKILTYLAEVRVNGHPDVKKPDTARRFRKAEIPEYDPYSPFPEGSRDRLKRLGRAGLVQWLRQEKRIQYTDTTFRDAHQSLLATRVRTIDLIAVAESFARNHPEVFSMEIWGGATFDVALRFLHECPWERLRRLREAMPNMLLQMLFRGANAVGYSAYPDNVITEFIVRAAQNGIDIFRIFDSMNWLEAMTPSIKAVSDRTEALAEACICYTGDLFDSTRRYTLTYYLDLARRLEDSGAHLLCIKDMAGLLKPEAAETLISELRSALGIPIHLHTHDTSGVQGATCLRAIDAGVDVIDLAPASMSGQTSQVNFNSIVALMRGRERELPLDLEGLNRQSGYWEAVREYYYPFESELRTGTAEVYDNEIPGGQYSNLRSQVAAVGLADRFEEVKKNYIKVNRLLGDIVKVTPTSKVVGDMAIFMTSNNLSSEQVVERAEQLSFPDSVVSFFRGELGQLTGGFPPELQRGVLKGQQPLPGAPNLGLPPLDLEGEFNRFCERFPSTPTMEDFLSWCMYPEVFKDYYAHIARFGRATPIPTPAFFYALSNNEEILVELDEGKTMVVRLLYVTDADENGVRTVAFHLNGMARAIEVRDRNLTSKVVSHRKAAGEREIGASLPGRLARVLVKEGEAIALHAPLFIIESMKMESVVAAKSAGRIGKVHLREGTIVDQGDLILDLV